MRKIAVLTFGTIQVIVIYKSNLYMSEALERHTDGFAQYGAAYFRDEIGLYGLSALNVDDVYFDVEET